MKKLIVSLGLALTLSFGATVDEGVEAFEKGDYKTALIIFEDLAAKGAPTYGTKEVGDWLVANL